MGNSKSKTANSQQQQPPQQQQQQQRPQQQQQHQPQQQQPPQEQKESKPLLVERSRQFLANVNGFLESKLVLDATAKRVLPHKWMERHAPFEHKELMEQKNLQGKRVGSLDELEAVAKEAQPVFATIVDKIVRDSGLDPSQVVTSNGAAVMLSHNTPFKVLSLAPLKGRERMTEKAQNELGGDFSKIVDVVRCSIVVFTEEQLENVARSLSNDEEKKEETGKSKGAVSFAVISKKDKGYYVVVRLKNRFKTPLFNGYRDALYNIVVCCGNGITHVCEVQLHLADIVAHKERAHVFYEYFRAYFSGSGVEESRMKALLTIRELEEKRGGAHADVEALIGSILRGNDIQQLENLATLLQDMMGDAQVALLIRRRIVELDHSPEAQSEYGSALQDAGKLAEAEPVLRGVLAGRKKQLGNSNPKTLNSMNNLAALLQAQGKLAEAEPLYREVLKERRQLLGNSHPSTIQSINNLASLLQAKGGKLDEAELLFREALQESRRQLSNSHPNTLNSMSNLAALLQAQGKLSEAEPLYREALEGSKRQLGRAHPSTFNAINNLAFFLHARGNVIEAESLFREALEGNRHLLGNAHPRTLNSIDNLASILKAQGELAAAEPLFREALAGKRQQLGDAHPSTMATASHLKSLLEAQHELQAKKK